ncbi:hypothetical protein FGM00_02285 [Aggregatimonas sangjinii]|uniref:MAE-28990/MAE-18760-like HEPN domain-containing protein n=1 Tax=Aggregatimonas sangjinii TaxID=2583587 RepID=A0A5B7SPU5_9FLAO|nr:hypothetical protein [Aggregatimonas sangjinii]QCW99000.1 hypothetical protein FGM00_02285 [Aggregatimonas sangjinii]
MTQETKDYIETWTKKISSHTGNDLATLFDKYTALFTLYNRLYNESFKQMRDNNQLSKTRYSDFEKATNLVVDFNSANEIIDRLKKRDNFDDIATIADLIRKDIFHINLANGMSQKDIDLELMQNLENKEPIIKAQGAVSTIYNVRCNMQHGEKHFEEHQRMLLEPLIRILDSIVELQIEKLTNEKS